MRDRGQDSTAEKLLAIVHSSQLTGLQAVCGALAGVRYLSRLPGSCYVGRSSELGKSQGLQYRH